MGMVMRVDLAMDLCLRRWLAVDCVVGSWFAVVEWLWWDFCWFVVVGDGVLLGFVVVSVGMW
jgi:hypothetical protein